MRAGCAAGGAHPRMLASPGRDPGVGCACMPGSCRTLTVPPASAAALPEDDSKAQQQHSSQHDGRDSRNVWAALSGSPQRRRWAGGVVAEGREQASGYGRRLEECMILLNGTGGPLVRQKGEILAPQWWRWEWRQLLRHVSQPVSVRVPQRLVMLHMIRHAHTWGWSLLTLSSAPGRVAAYEIAAA